jgi:amino acid transporter
LPTFWFGPTTSTSFGDYALAIYSALWAYDGWNSLNVVCEELINPEKNLPKAVIGGPFIVMICYVFTNLGYFVVLEPSYIQFSKAIAIDFGQVVLGSFGRLLFTCFVCLACLSAAHANVFSGSRIIWVSFLNIMIEFIT